MIDREQPGLNIDVSQTTPVVCEECGHDAFTSVFKIRKLSALIAPSGQETIVPVQAFACAKCGHINTDFLPKIPKKRP